MLLKKVRLNDLPVSANSALMHFLSAISQFLWLIHRAFE